jgi:hypothetical protein
VGARSAGVSGVKVDKAVDFVAVGRGGDVVAVLAVFEVSLFAEAEACVRGELLVLRAMRMLGRS